jgi:hypothetical protein
MLSSMISAFTSPLMMAQNAQGLLASGTSPC